MKLPKKKKKMFEFTGIAALGGESYFKKRLNSVLLRRGKNSNKSKKS